MSKNIKEIIEEELTEKLNKTAVVSEPLPESIEKQLEQGKD